MISLMAQKTGASIPRSCVATLGAPRSSFYHAAKPTFDPDRRSTAWRTRGVRSSSTIADVTVIVVWPRNSLIAAWLALRPGASDHGSGSPARPSAQELPSRKPATVERTGLRRIWSSGQTSPSTSQSRLGWRYYLHPNRLTAGSISPSSSTCIRVASSAGAWPITCAQTSSWMRSARHSTPPRSAHYLPQRSRQPVRAQRLSEAALAQRRPPPKHVRARQPLPQRLDRIFHRHPQARNASRRLLHQECCRCPYRDLRLHRRPTTTPSANTPLSDIKSPSQFEALIHSQN